MCLIVFSLGGHPDYDLIFAGNRDEFHGRPTQPAHFWDEAQHLLAGRDLKAGGTWLGVTRQGRFATVTNFREPGEQGPDARSRGELVVDFLRTAKGVRQFVSEVHDRSTEYNGFNLIVGEKGGLQYLTNRNGPPRALEPGLYGLSNGWLDTPWPKVRRSKQMLEERIASNRMDVESLFDLLRDDWRPSDEALPRTGLDLEIERRAAAIFIADPFYGTRSSTVVLIGRDGRTTFAERSFAPDGAVLATEKFEFDIEPVTH